ncbi:MAG: hypothetical protein HYU52_04460 [Acidobacteria bacterium]|nr:hypothetical protein [Acidobacteriota bacterium]
MRRVLRSVLPIIVSLLLVVPSCGRATKPETPEELVVAMRKAYERKDADAIMALTADPAILPKGAMKRQQERYDRERDRDELEVELKRNGMWYRAWKDAKFVSAREHGDHVHVTVETTNVPTEIVLVRQDGFLKIHPAPGSFD